MSEQKKKINFTVACVNEFARWHNLNIQEAFRYLFKFKGITFIKENYEAEHTLDFGTIVEDLGILCRKNGGMLYKKTSSQYSFHTEKSIKLLRRVDD